VIKIEKLYLYFYEKQKVEN